MNAVAEMQLEQSCVSKAYAESMPSQQGKKHTVLENKKKKSTEGEREIEREKESLGRATCFDYWRKPFWLWSMDKAS